MTNAESQLKDVVMRLDNFLKEGLAKTVSYFLRGISENCCRVEVTGKRVNLAMEKGYRFLAYFIFWEKQNLSVN